MRLLSNLTGFITDPKKIIEFPITITQMAFKFAQDILKLVVHG